MFHFSEEMNYSFVYSRIYLFRRMFIISFGIVLEVKKNCNRNLQNIETTGST